MASDGYYFKHRGIGDLYPRKKDTPSPPPLPNVAELLPMVFLELSIPHLPTWSLDGPSRDPVGLHLREKI